MSTKRYFWLKLKENFFQDKTIKKLRKIAGGDTYTVIYLKLMLLGLKDGGKLFFDGVENSFHEELALEIDEDSENVKFTLMFLEKTGLLEEINESELFLTRMPEMIGSETDKAELMRRKRAQNRVQSGNNVTGALPGVTLCYTEIEKEKDKEIEREKEETAAELPAPPRPSVPYEAIKDFYNQVCVSFPRCTTMSENRKKAIKARFTSGYTLEDFKKVFIKAEGSSFLKGRNDRNWTATFDWMIKDGNMAKILEGNYDDHDMGPGPGPGPRPAGGGRNNTGFQTSNPFLEMLNEERDKR
nr:MAG TPA: replisome organizer protein [Caudoviricetes sp.]